LYLFIHLRLLWGNYLKIFIFKKGFQILKSLKISGLPPTLVDPRSTRWLQIGGSSGDGAGNGGVPVPTCWRQLEVAPITFWCCFFAHCLPFTICLIWPNELRRFNFELRYDGNGSLDTATCWAHNGD